MFNCIGSRITALVVFLFHRSDHTEHHLVDLFVLMQVMEIETIIFKPRWYPIWSKASHYVTVLLKKQLVTLEL